MNPLWTPPPDLITGKLTESTRKREFCQSKFTQIWHKEKTTPISLICRNGWIFIQFKWASPSIEEHQTLPESSLTPHLLGKMVGLHCCCCQHYISSCLQFSVSGCYILRVILINKFILAFKSTQTPRKRLPGKPHSEEAHSGVCLLMFGFWQFVSRYDPCGTVVRRAELSLGLFSIKSWKHGLCESLLCLMSPMSIFPPSPFKKIK